MVRNSKSAIALSAFACAILAACQAQNDGEAGVGAAQGMGADSFAQTSETGDADARQLRQKADALVGKFVPLDGGQAARSTGQSLREPSDAALLEQEYNRYSGSPTTAEAKRAFAAARTGDGEARYQYARRLYRGDGVTSGRTAVNYWLHKAAQEGHAYAQAHYGFRLFEGIGIDKTYRAAPFIFNEAAKWVNRSAAQGDPFGYYSRAQLVWPTDFPQMASLMEAGQILPGKLDFDAALADMARAEAACARSPYSSSERYREFCKSIRTVRRQWLNNSRSVNARRDDDYYRQQSQDQWNQRQQDDLNQRIFENEMSGMGMGW